MKKSKLRRIPEINIPVPLFAKGGLGGICFLLPIQFRLSIPPAPLLQRGVNILGNRLNPKATLGGSVWRMKPQLVTLMLLASMLVCPEPTCAALVPNLFSANNTNKPLANIPAVATPVENLSDLKGKLDGLETLRDRLDKGTNDSKAPEGVRPEEVSEKRRLIESLIFFYQEGLNSLTATETEQENLKLAEAQSGKWTGFSDPPV